jgi:hypothetical protein
MRLLKKSLRLIIDSIVYLFLGPIMFTMAIIWAVIRFAYLPDSDNLWHEIKASLKDAKEAIDLKV